MKNIKLNHIDHVAIRVKDLEISAAWYTKVLGLRKKYVKEWGPFPIFMLSGSIGIALFPADVNELSLPIDSKAVKIDHFAFNVDNANFIKAKEQYDHLCLNYEIQDHIYFDSIYTKDPDGHTV